MNQVNGVSEAVFRGLYHHRTPPVGLLTVWWTVLIQVANGEKREGGRGGGGCSYKPASARRGEPVEVSEPDRKLIRRDGLSSRFTF